jgi:glycogen debranching enzyme
MVDFDKKVNDIFTLNTITGYSRWQNREYTYISPAITGYPYQWLWDTMFHAIVLSHYDNKRAKEEIRTFFLAQLENGFLPHIIFWNDTATIPLWARLLSRKYNQIHFTDITQPPMAAIAVEYIYNKDKDIKYVKEILPKLDKFHKFLLRERDPYSTGLLSIISVDESGMDELPIFQYAAGLKSNNFLLFHFFNRKADILNKYFKYDIKKIFQLDYFIIKEVLFNTIFIEANYSLSRLYLAINKPQDAEFYKQKAEQALQQLIALCWDEKDEIFFSIYSKRNRKIPIKTVASLVPLYIKSLKKEYADALVQKHIVNKDEFLLPYPFPSVAKDEIFHQPNAQPFYWLKALWRGPVWINTNWLIIKGLYRHGYTSLAQTVIGRSMHLIEQQGFREYYNPVTGLGYGKNNFTWPALMLDLI